jgi:sugar lactone lactonase YvrE
MRSFRTALLGAIALAAAATASAAPFPDPQANAPRALGQSEIVADFAVGNFLENLVVTASGDVIVTDFVAKTLWRIDPETGARTAFATFDRNIAGVVAYRGGYLVTSPSETGSVVYFVSRAGAVSEFVALPAGVYSNGIAAFGGNRFLIADSAGGGVWLLNAGTRETTNWVRDERLTPAGASSPFIPAANGVRRQGGYVYVSSMHRQLLLRSRINRDGSAGPLETIAENVFLDDFAVGSDGVVFATTHVFDSVLRITPDGQVTTVADHSNGLRGPTSISFGPRRGGVQSFYVTNNGQLYIQPATGPETGRLVRIDLPTDLARR